jgi:putative MFS transporter
MWTTSGFIVGGLLTGLAADAFGRLRPMFVTIAMVIVGGICAASAQTFQQLVFWRFVTALGLGGDLILAYGLLTEFAPPRTRGRWLAWVALLGNLGLPLCLLMGHFILPGPDGWRMMIAIPAVAAIVVLLLRLMLTESPRWLATVGRYAQADLIVAAVEAQARKASEPVLVPAPSPRASTNAKERFGTYVAVGAAIHVGTMAAVFGFVSWLPTFFATSLSIKDSTLFAGLMAAGAPAGTLVAFFVTDRVERKWGVVGAALLAALLGVAYVSASNVQGVIALGFATVTSLYVMATLGVYTYVPELFDTRRRLRVIGLLLMLGRLAALAMPFAVVPLFTAGGQAGVYMLIFALLLIQAAVVALFGPRTRGVSLDAI